jgi:hypothetical protein
MRKIELLSPAKDIECGMAAINHGADAIYIGAQKFGARAAAGNSTSDIEKLAEYAHKYNANVYVTVNTILKDSEIEKLSQEYPIVKGYELAKNSGQHAALLAGYKQSHGDIVVSLDDDGQIAVEQRVCDQTL